MARSVFFAIMRRDKSVFARKTFCLMVPLG